MRHKMNGYTLIEMVVSIAIITIMLGVVIGTYSLGRRHEEVKYETDRLASMIRNARTRAVNGITYPITPCDLGAAGGFCMVCSLDPATTCTADADCISANKGHCASALYPQGGYGVHLTDDATDAVVLFADAVSGSLPYYTAPQGNDIGERVEGYELPSAAELVLGSTNDPSELEIIFYGSTTLLYQRSSGGAWAPVTPVNGVYEINILPQDGCSSATKKGIIAIDVNANRIYESQENCL